MLFHAEHIEPRVEPAVDQTEQLSGVIALALIAPEPRDAHCRAEFPPFCLLLTDDGKRVLENLRFRRILVRISAVDWGPLPIPGLSLFDLRRKLEQQVLLAEAADKLYSDR
jgi:hypothetical protein